VKTLPAKNLIQALENSVSDSRTDGRFLQVSGLRFRANLARPEGSRILEVIIERPGKRVTAGMSDGELDFSVSVGMSAFVGDGFDGFYCMQDGSRGDGNVYTMVGFEGAMSDTGLFLQIFRKDSESSEHVDEGVVRARSAVVIGSEGGLPAVRPTLDNRITFSTD
jgi:5'-nucleotidase